MKKFLVILALALATATTPAYAGEDSGADRNDKKCEVTTSGEGGGYRKDKCSVVIAGEGGGY